MTQTNPIKTMFNAKYALSGGITEGEYRPSGTPGWWTKTTSRFHDSFKMGASVFETYEEAVQAANVARAKKIASLKKQIAKLEKLEF
jgi:hypothetical protein